MKYKLIALSPAHAFQILAHNFFEDPQIDISTIIFTETDKTPRGYYRKVLSNENGQYIVAFKFPPHIETPIHDHQSFCASQILEGHVTESFYKKTTNLDKVTLALQLSRTPERNTITMDLNPGETIHSIKSGENEVHLLHFYMSTNLGEFVENPNRKTDYMLQKKTISHS